MPITHCLHATRPGYGPGVSVSTRGQSGVGSLGSQWAAWGVSGHPGPGLAGGSRCLTLARRRAREAAPARRVADHGALLQPCGVRWRSSKEAQQHVVVTQSREGADSQLHLGKGRAAHARTLPSRPGERATSQPSPARATCPLVCSLAALLNVDPCPLESSLEPNSTSPEWDPLGSLQGQGLGLPWILRGTPGQRGPCKGQSSCAQAQHPQPGAQPCVAPGHPHSLGEGRPSPQPGARPCLGPRPSPQPGTQPCVAPAIPTAKNTALCGPQPSPQPG